MISTKSNPDDRLWRKAGVREQIIDMPPGRPIPCLCKMQVATDAEESARTESRSYIAVPTGGKPAFPEPSHPDRAYGVCENQAVHAGGCHGPRQQNASILSAALMCTAPFDSTAIPWPG